MVEFFIIIIIIIFFNVLLTLGHTWHACVRLVNFGTHTWHAFVT